MTIRLTLFFPLCLFFAAAAAFATELPDPEPWRTAIRGATRLPLRLTTETVKENGRSSHLPVFSSGNKSVRIGADGTTVSAGQANHLGIFVENEPALLLQWWGDIPGAGYGYPFADIAVEPGSYAVDPAARRVTYQKPYLDEHGRRSVFRYTLTARDDDRLELAWDTGISPASLWFTAVNYRNRNLFFGDRLFPQSSTTELTALPDRTATFPAVGDFAHAPDEPAYAFLLQLDGMRGTVAESCLSSQEEAEHFILHFQQDDDNTTTNRIIIDLGDSPALLPNAPPPVGGIDFWRDDAMHVPSPATRNLFPNPSFEQGLRYWTWMSGDGCHVPEARRRYEILPKGLFGAQALLVRSTQPDTVGMVSFPLSLESDQEYTLSFWARAEGEPHSFRLGLSSAGQDGKFGIWEDICGDEALHAVDVEWKRFSRTFQADDMGVAVMIASYGETLLDGIQLEAGNTPTDFIAPPLEGMLVSPRPDNDILPAQADQLGFVFSGIPGTEGEVHLTITNAFREVVHQQSFTVRLDKTGNAHVALTPDPHQLGEGVFAIKTEYAVAGSPTYYDFHRFSIMTPLINSHATKDIFGTLQSYASIDRGTALAAKHCDWGFGSTSWGYRADTPAGKLQARLERRHGIANFAHTYTGKETEHLRLHDRGTLDMLWESVTPEMEKEVEDTAFNHASRYDPKTDRVWAFGNEDELGRLIGGGRFDEHFRLVAALDRGIRRAIPQAIILPSNGTSGYSAFRGHDIMEGYLTAAQRQGYRYGAVAVHPYGNIDGGILGKHDLDTETERLLAQLPASAMATRRPSILPSASTYWTR